jgi:hypothetical protein
VPRALLPYSARAAADAHLEEQPADEQIVAIHQSLSNFQQHRIIWMDGRPHPSPYAEHTWMGFSTGRFEGDTLVVRTTHIKQMWHRRNGLPQSDRAVLTERYIRHGNVLTHVSITRTGQPHRAPGQNHEQAAQPARVHPAAADLPVRERGGVA